jgi:hypothetical protein
MAFYFIITTTITFVTLMDTIDANTISSITTFEWVKLALKSAIPSLMTIKAFVDPSINEMVEKETHKRKENK